MGRRAMINTSTTLVILFSFVLCSLYTLSGQRQIVNYFESSSRIATLESKVHELEVNIVTQFLNLLDANTSSREMHQYMEVSRMLEENSLQLDYTRNRMKASVSAVCSKLQGNQKAEARRLEEFPQYNGTKFMLKLAYEVSDGLGNEVHGEDEVLVDYPIDFDKLLAEIDSMKAYLENTIGETDFSNMTEEQIRNYVIGLSSRYVGECRVHFSQIHLDQQSLTICCRLLCSTSFQGALDSAERKFTVYDELSLTFYQNSAENPHIQGLEDAS
jgi:hypothetical protein